MIVSREIKGLKSLKKFGEFDVLLTQFSYATWKGGKNGKRLEKVLLKKS